MSIILIQIIVTFVKLFGNATRPSAVGKRRQRKGKEAS